MDETTELKQCNWCSRFIPDDDWLIISGETTCSDCRFACDRCNEISLVDNSYTVDDSDNWCEICFNEMANSCGYCSNYFHQDTMTWMEDIGVSYCEYDTNNNSNWCEDCDLYYVNECTGRRCTIDDRTIHDYSYKPDTIFHPENAKLYFGIEIEAEAEDNEMRRMASEYAQTLEKQGLAYLKNDGSLDCGFEIVTHPMTHEFFMNSEMALWSVLRVLKNDYAMKSWSTDTCGLHIHISRAGFNGGSHQHKFLRLVYHNQQLYQALAGRASTQWAKFDDVNDGEGKMSFRDKMNNRIGSDRYSAVNTNNTRTLELRIFRGSLNPRFIKSSIDLAHASVEYTRNLTVRNILDGDLSAERFVAFIRSKPDVYPSLNQRLSMLYNKVEQIIEQERRAKNVSTSRIVTEQHA